MKSNVGRFSPFSSQSSSIYPQQYSGTNYLSAYGSTQSSATQNQLSNDNKSSNNSNKKEDNYPTEGTLTLTQNEPTRFRISIGKLQPELEAEHQKFASTAHTFSAEELSDTLKNKNATKNIERLNGMSQEYVELMYKLTNIFALSDDDNTEQRVIDGFLKGKGLENIIINGKVYQGLLFDENSQQSKNLKESSIFDTYFNDYLSCMNNEIRKCIDNGEINIENISKNLETMLKKPNFSDWGTILSDDFYALMGGTQNIEIEIEITPISDGEYKLNTTMYINDWYGADSDDINDHTNLADIAKDLGKAQINTNPIDTNPIDNTFIINYYINKLISNPKSFIPGLDNFFWLQHHHGCKPFPTQIIYKSEDKIKLD